MPTAMPVAPLSKQVRQLRGQDDRLRLRAVVVRAEVDRVLVELVEQARRERREAALRVAHGGGGIAVERAEVAGAVDERAAHANGCAMRTSAS